ncbi:MerR family transcriptional regulator [Neobacillus drentensis]|uniref:MerR family transcriptional regulator n=1 Tax=Neobacillus drentensis TaxID=220684 RepID=UPI002FFDC9FA
MSELYSPKNVQELLGIDSHTLRKYATLLEGHGYPIHRNTKGHRGYFDKDVNTLRRLIEISKQDGMTHERAAISVMTSDDEKVSTGTEPEAELIQPAHDQDIQQDCNHDDLLERIEHLEQINLDLIKHLKEKAVREASLEEKLNQILNYVKRTEQFVVERSQIEEETRRQIAAASQKKWWKWWK